MPRFNPGQFRHQVDVYLPSTALDVRGRRTGAPTLVLSGLPCSIELMQSLELIRAQKVWAEATHRVRCFQDPSNPLTERHYLLWGLVALHIGAVVDQDNTGIEVELLCKEERQIAGVGGGTPIVGQRPALLYLSANGTLDPVKCNLSATTAPTVNDDAGDGYEVRSQWWDTAADTVYLCVDPSAGAAVWLEWQGPAGEGIASGGTTGQVLAKASDDDFDTEWVDEPGGSYEPAGAVATHAALTTGVHGLAITAGQTLTVTTGGTLGSAAYTASTAYATAGHNHTGTYEPAGAVATHAALTTGVHGLGTASQQDVGYFALAGHNHSGVYLPAATKLDDLGTPDDNTDLDATTGRHGLLPKLGGGSSNFLRADGTWAAPAGGAHDALTLAASVTDVFSLSTQELQADDAGADKLVFWDDSESKLTHAAVGAGLETSGATLQTKASVRTGQVGITIDGGGSAITTGLKGFVRVPYAGTITKATLLADQSGTIVIDVWKDTYANAPPTDADSITASAPPTLSSATKSEDGTLTGWTTAVTAGDVLAFSVDSAATVTRVTLLLEITKS
jgi:hypothetical protein